jgi:UDP-glucose 4-epimerase
MSILITGVAGFIGSNLANRFIATGKTIVGVDNLCLGKLENIKKFENEANFHFSKIDINDYESFFEYISECNKIDPITEVWHLAANSDIPAGIADIEIDLTNTFKTTLNVLKVMKSLNLKVLYFASTSAVYGDLGNSKLTENIGPLFPISNYGAMKLASEALISASVESYLDKAYIFRFPNVIGTPATHGVILDFINKLKINNSVLDVLGNGTQQKSYLHVEELINAMFFISNNSNEKINYFNIGNLDEGVTVKFIAESVIEIVSPSAKINFGLGNKGWVGDVPKFNYSIDKLLNLGWRPKLKSSEAIKLAITQIYSDNHS